MDESMRAGPPIMIEKTVSSFQIRAMFTDSPPIGSAVIS